VFLAADDLDPQWPPVLIAFVFGVFVVAAVAAFVMFRQARAATRGDADLRNGSHRKGRKR
jgi:hypothetical protein